MKSFHATPERRPMIRQGRRALARLECLEGRRLLAGGLATSDLLPAPTLSAELSSRSDPDGNGVVLVPAASIVGNAAPGSLVGLDRDSDGDLERVTRADGRGRFRFPVALAFGRSTFRIVGRDAAGSVAETALTVTRGDVIIAWNATLLDTVRSASTGPPQAARAMAMVHLATLDAVMAASNDQERYHFQGSAPASTSAPAAAAQAAYRVLTGLYPDQAARLGAALSESLASIPSGPARAMGRRLGDAVGAGMLELRANDGSTTVVGYTPGFDPGDWIPTPPRFLPPLAPQWPAVTPFVLDSTAEFRPGPPPALTSVEYAAAYNQVKEVGGVASSSRTADQTELAKFWSDLPGTTFTPPGHWNQIAQDAALRARGGLARNARLFATLNAALADAGICCWDAKYYYDFWRPVTAIREGDFDGNPETVADPNWTPLWATPNFSAYTSGHSTFSGAAQVVLEAFFGTRFEFSDTGDPTLNLAPRRFASFEEAAEEAGVSRIFGGIHYAFDNVVGLEGGRRIGGFVVERLASAMAGPIPASSRRTPRD